MTFHSKFPTNQDVAKMQQQLRDFENERRKAMHTPRMTLAYNAHLPSSERMRQVMQDIAIEYPNIDCETLKAIATIEKPIKGCHEDYSEFYDDEIRIYRLFNIMQTIADKPQYKPEFEKALKDIKETYNSFLNNFSYANPGEQLVTTIMRLIKKSTNDNQIRLPE